MGKIKNESLLGAAKTWNLYSQDECNVVVGSKKEQEQGDVLVSEIPK